MPLWPDHIEGLIYPGPDFRIRLLGSPSITWEGTPFSIPRRYVRALLYRLACDPQPITRQHLQLLFWPDLPEELARRNLSHHLTHLRRAFTVAHTLLTTGDLVWLDPQLVWCDVVQFKDAILNARGDRSALHSAVGLYRGTFLDGFCLPHCAEFEHWCVLERNLLERLYLEALATLVDHCTSRGEISLAIEYARRYLETDDLSEEIHQRLIRLYAAIGDRAAALQQFERCSAALERQLGVSPLPETRAVFQAVLHGYLRFPKPVAPAHAPQLPGLEVPLVGRSQAMRQLEEAFAKTLARCGQVILISGEAGIGKSRLMHEFASHHQDQARVLYGAAHAGEQAIPYQPILDTLRMLVGAVTREQEQYQVDPSPASSLSGFLEAVWLSEISRLVPELHIRYPDLPPPLPLEPESARTRLFDALCRLFLAFTAAQGPGILCLDDLQWADATTQAWLVHLGRSLESGRHAILVLGTYRSEEADTVIDLRRALARLRVVSELKLAGLDESAVLELLRDLIGRRCEDEALARQLHKATGGNPFFLIETLRAMVEDRMLPEDLSILGQLPLPESVREAIQGRLQRLGPKARQVLEAGAVLGLSFGFDLLRLTAGRSEIETMDSLDELVARQLLVEMAEEHGFIHELTHRVAVEGFSRVRKQLLHRRAGRAYERLAPDKVTLLSHHFESAGNWQKALHYHGLASQRALALFAWQEAELHQERILALLARIDPACERPQLISQRGDILADRAHARYLQGRLAGRDADLEELSKLGETSRDDRVRLQALVHRVRYLNLDGEYSQSIAVAEEGLVLISSSLTLSEEAELGLRTGAQLLAQIGFAHYFLGQPLQALEALEEALALCGESADPETCGRILHIQGYVYFHLGDYARSLECQQKAYACHKEVGDYNRMAWDLIDIGALHKNLGDPAEAKRCLEEGLDLSRRVGAHPAESYGLAHFGSWDLYQGDYAAAVLHYRQALEMQQRLGSEHISATAEAGIGLALYHLGDFTQSRSWLERALQRARKTGHRRRLAETLIELSLVDLAEGHLPVARQRLEEGLAIAQESQASECLAAGLAALARLERLASEPARALQEATEAVNAARKIGLDCCEMWGEIEAGLAHLALGDPSAALEHTRRAADLAPQASQDWIGSEEAHRAHALALHALGQTEEAEREEDLAQAILQARVEPVAGIGV